MLFSCISSIASMYKVLATSDQTIRCRRVEASVLACSRGEVRFERWAGEQWGGLEGSPDDEDEIFGDRDGCDGQKTDC